MGQTFAATHPDYSNKSIPIPSKPGGGFRTAKQWLRYGRLPDPAQPGFRYKGRLWWSLEQTVGTITRLYARIHRIRINDAATPIRSLKDGTEVFLTTDCWLSFDERTAVRCRPHQWSDSRRRTPPRHRLVTRSQRRLRRKRDAEEAQQPQLQQQKTRASNQTTLSELVRNRIKK